MTSAAEDDISACEQALGRLDYDAAYKAFDKATKADPTNAVAFFGKAEAALGVPKVEAEEILALYKKAIELAPEAAQYREYLGEFYHALKHSDDALATWREIAAGKNRNAKSLGRLAEVLSGFGYLQEAIEAMAAAKPLIATNLGGPREMIENDHTGILIPPKDPDTLAEKICELLQSQALRMKLGENARRVALERFTIKRYTQEIQTICRKVLEGD